MKLAIVNNSEHLAQKAKRPWYRLHVRLMPEFTHKIKQFTRMPRVDRPGLQSRKKAS